ATLACGLGATDGMMSWQAPDDYGQETPDPYVRVVPLADMIDETAKMIDGTSAIMKKRIQLLRKVEDILEM
ncbi:MAG: hypothetical protein CMH54_14825, partial [Myxococcales bacterium]|nr:hypothetical protein [Myxococcales bacterium]